MSNSKDLFNGGNNPYHEAFTAEDAALTKMVLDENEIEYNQVQHENSARFFVEEKVENMEKRKEELMERISNGDNQSLKSQLNNVTSNFDRYLPKT